MAAENSSDQRPVIQASEILAKIERGEDVYYDGVIIEGDLDISGLRLPTEYVDRTDFEVLLELSNKLKVISSIITIVNSEILDDVKFNNALFHRETSFRRVEFSGYGDFQGAEFGKHADFLEAKFCGYANFQGVEFYGDANFERAKFSEHADFLETGFNGYARFERVKFDGNANFGWTLFTGIYANFNGAEFFGYADLDGAEFDRNTLSFKYTKFYNPKSQEVACRIAKRKMEDQGNKKEADYYFYREMEAVRIQNGIKGIKQKAYQPPANIRELLSQLRDRIALIPSKIKRFLIHDVLEYIFIQRIFGYGVRPFNVAKAWLSVVFFLGVLYWAGAGVVRGNEPLEWYEYFYFSIVTAATPGYAGYTPATGFYTLIAGAQAIFGTFMWAAFIATFARKWQR